MNNINANLHNYYIKLVNLYNYTCTNIGHFYLKFSKFYTFFYYTSTDVNALKVFVGSRFGAQAQCYWDISLMSPVQ